MTGRDGRGRRDRRRVDHRREAAACPCGSGAAYSACCRVYHLRHQDPPTAEALMRSRYSAISKGLMGYIEHSWHEDYRPEDLGGNRAEWLGLQIVATEAGRIEDSTGTVEFIATWRQDDTTGVLHERSRFERVAGRWVYTDGDLL